MTKNQLKERIAYKKRELATLEEELAAHEIHMRDIQPYAVFNIIPACQDIVVLIPTPDGEYMMGGLERDFKKFWSDCNGRGGNTFTQKEMFDKLTGLNATKSNRKIIMTDM